MRWLLGLLVMLTAAPALAFEGEIEAKSFGDPSGEDVEFTIYVSDKRDGEVSDFWLSDRYPATMWQNVFSFEANKGESPTSEWTRIAERQYGVKPGFIMKMVSKDKRGKESGLEVTRMEEKKVAADKFAIPPGYEVATMPDMPSGTPTMKRPTTKEEAEKMRDEWMKKMQEEQR